MAARKRSKAVNKKKPNKASKRSKSPKRQSKKLKRQSKRQTKGARRDRESKKRHAKRIHCRSNASALGKLRAWLLPSVTIFAGLRLHGNTTWSPSNLVWLALCWAWSEARNVTDAFADAMDQCAQMDCGALSTYQGFMNALVTRRGELMPVMWQVIQQRMSEIGGKFYRVHGWVPIAFDGSRSSAPRTRSNEQDLCAKNYGKGKTAKYRKKKTKGMRRGKNERNKAQPQGPQVWITMMWHMGLRLPWVWRLGPSDSSERAQVTEMLVQEQFPEKTLFCGDAGFIGYPLWSAIIQKGCDFLVRVGANVSLLAETSDFAVDKHGKVLCWPKNVRRSNQPPLELRLVRVKLKKTWVWMLTSVRDSSRLTDKQIVNFYKKRWGVEVEFRGLKQTLDRAKLRCRDSKRVLAELNWSIMAMLVAELFALREQLAEIENHIGSPVPYDPTKLSLANTMRALRCAMKRLWETPEDGKDLQTLLRQAVTDSYKRKSSKKSRYRPPNPDKKPLGDPTVRALDEEERQKLNAIRCLQIAA